MQAGPQLVTIAELGALLADPAMAEMLSAVTPGGRTSILVDLSSVPGSAGARELPARLQPACPVIGMNPAVGQPLPEIIDVLAADADDAERISTAIDANPIAASVLVRVVRHNAGCSVAAGLLVESLAYSTLQHGDEFIRWLADRSHSRAGAAEDSPAVPPLRVARDRHRLELTFDRPRKRNAFSAGLRDALTEALELPIHDPTLTEIVLAGVGPAFCAGGDLDEFGAARDAAVAHVTRMTRSAGALLHELRARTTCHVHGACIGAGIELPAFTGKIVASHDAFFQLPEMTMGLIPGAGGTVSITHRIGRLRTAWLALTSARIDAQTALGWGLIDELVPKPE